MNKIQSVLNRRPATAVSSLQRCCARCCGGSGGSDGSSFVGQCLLQHCFDVAVAAAAAAAATAAVFVVNFYCSAALFAVAVAAPHRGSTHT
jgi:hypothetical protein